MERIGLTPNIIQSLKTVEEMEALTKAASDSIGAEIAREVARALLDEVADKADKAQQAKFLLAVDSTLKNMVREGKEVPRE